MRKEKDSMGSMQVPDDAYYGAQTQRAVENFPISGITISKSMIRALGIIKRSAAMVNHKLGILDEERKKCHRSRGGRNHQWEILMISFLLIFIRQARVHPAT